MSSFTIGEKKMKANFYRLFATLLIVFLLAACGNAASTPTPVPTAVPQQDATATLPAPAEEQPGEPVSLTVMTHNSFAVTEDIIRQFEQENNVTLNFIQAGDTGSALNRAILSKGAPLADVFYGVDNTFLSRALAEDIFEAYASPNLADIPDTFKLDPENRALPVDYGDVCINYDLAYFEENNLAVPQTLQELTQPEYSGLLVVENPATSSPGLAFMLATIAEFGEDGYLEYWAQLRENNVAVVNDWDTAYYTNFSGSFGQGRSRWSFRTDQARWPKLFLRKHR
jgi:thiamine transport system substrate-binding protein